eukprot:1624715-Lingulodinium_polyedra.AAC.1
MASKHKVPERVARPSNLDPREPAAQSDPWAFGFPTLAACQLGEQGELVGNITCGFLGPVATQGT